MRFALPLVALTLLICPAGCDSNSGTRRAEPKRAAAKAPSPRPTAPQAAAPKPRPATERLARPVPVWRVVSVHDGDTLRALDENETEHKIRLGGIDAPEIGQPFGTRSRDRLAALVKGKSVAVHGLGSDQYGRDLARIEIDGADVNRTMVADGMAWHYVRYSSDAGLAAAEADARAAKRGLWADRDPVAPWEWRSNERDRKARSDGR